jgi:hypothetical protein
MTAMDPAFGITVMPLIVMLAACLGPLCRYSADAPALHPGG